MNLKRFLLLGNIILSCLILWAGVSIVATWASSGRTAAADVSVPSKMYMPKDRAASKGKRLEDYALITAKDVFHTSKEIAKTAGKDDEDIKVTDLNLELKGTVVGDGKDSYAFILEKGSKKEEVYYANDYVMGAQILRIMKGRVILNVNGSEEALLMADESRTLPEMGSSEEKAGAEAVKPAEQKPAAQGATPPPRRIITPRRGMGKTGGS
jgi:type II secretory pathway component PulC